jgi:hypothetical protein
VHRHQWHCGHSIYRNVFEIRPLRRCCERESRFHSLVAKLLYLGKRSRDILTTVAFLSTRVLKATEEDWKKLVKLVRYLRGTERLVSLRPTTQPW